MLPDGGHIGTLSPAAVAALLATLIDIRGMLVIAGRGPGVILEDAIAGLTPVLQECCVMAMAASPCSTGPARARRHASTRSSSAPACRRITPLAGGGHGGFSASMPGPPA